MTHFSKWGAAQAERGASMLAVVAVLFILGLLGMAVVRMVTITQTTGADQVTYEKAFYVNQAGVEYAVRKIYEANSPVVAEPGIAFGQGSFIIDRQGRTVTVTGRVGSSQVVHSVQSPTQADCTQLDMSGAHLVSDGKKLNQLRFNKICLQQVVLDKITFGWAPNNGTPQHPETLNKIKMESQTLYDHPSVPAGTLIELADFIMTLNGQNNMNEVAFDQAMDGRTFTMTVIFQDGSTKGATFTPSD